VESIAELSRGATPIRPRTPGSSPIAAELGTTENAILQAKTGILKRLRQEAGELFD